MEDPGSRRVRQPLLPIENKLMAALMVVLLGLYASTGLYPAVVHSWDQGIQFVTFNHFRPYLFYGIVSITLSLAVLMVVALLRGRAFAWAPLAMFMLGPLFCYGAFLMDWSSTIDQASVKDRDGTEYHLLVYADFDPGSHLIGKVESKSFLQTRYRVIAENMKGRMPVVRPKGAKENPQLYLNARHQLVGVDFENCAVVCFDLSRGSQVMAGDLSPFALLGPKDEPNLEDYRTLTNFKEEGVPDFGVVLEEFDHPNPRVRALARGLACRLVLSL